MHLIRRFEEGAEQAYMRGLIHGTMHLSIGQEASAVGICMPLTDADYITSTHRGHGHCIAKGADIGRMFAEFFGKEDGYCHGRGGSMHIADPSKGNLGANGIVGGGIPIAVGAALSAKRRKTDRVVISFFGDGANNEGAFHEALNMASVWKLPVIFVCENNRYGMSTSTERSTAVPNVADRASAYAMPGVIVDGNDFGAVAAASFEAVERARRGEGPTLIESRPTASAAIRAPTATATAPRRRSRPGRRATRSRPSRRNCCCSGCSSAEEVKAIEDEAERDIEAAVAFANASPSPKTADLTKYVYSS